MVLWTFWKVNEKVFVEEINLNENAGWKLVILQFLLKLNNSYCVFLVFSTFENN